MFLILKGEFDMWQYIALISLGINISFIAYLKFKKPEIVNVQGDLIESQKVKDNSKVKNRKGMFGWLKLDPKKKAERLKEKELRKQNKNS